MGWLSRMAETEAEKLMKRKVLNFKGVPIASNQDSKLYIEYSELNGFKFLVMKLYGPIKIETHYGCEVTFVGDQDTIELESDTTEINTDYSRSLKTGITEFEVDLEEPLMDMIMNHTVVSIEVRVKRKAWGFDVENQEALQEMIK